MKSKQILWELGRWAAAALMVVLLFLMAGTTPKTKDVSVEELEALTMPLLKEGETQKGEGRMLRRFYGLNPSDFQGAVLYYPSTNMGCEELLLVKLTDPAQAETVQQAIAARLESQKASFDGYGVEQTAMLNDDVVIEVRGTYVLFAVSASFQEIREAFLGAL